MKKTIFLVFLAIAASAVNAAESAGEPAPVDFRWGVKIPLRDGVELNATLYRPLDQAAPLPCVFTLTPYIAQSYHDRGTWFARHGYVFLTVDVRGRGNSGGEFMPMLQEAKDGHDIVEWLSTQPYCTAKVSMWGGSYAGYNQWATAKEFPPHLAAIVPVASPMPGVDYPMRNNVFYPYDMQWLTLVSGRTAQDKLFGDATFWRSLFKRWYREQKPFAELDTYVGNPSPIFRTWIAHPHQDAYWDAFVPTPEQYARLSLPILTITGQFDGDQPGALAFYRAHMQHGSAAAKANHFLIIGPWDHAGTRTPQAQYGGLKFAQASVLDMNALHQQWYDWTLKDGAKPGFLKARVAYYVTVAERWRYADTLEAVTAEQRPLFLASENGRANDVFASGTLGAKAGSGIDSYVYDPADISSADVPDAEGNDLVDQHRVFAQNGKQLVYHSAPFDRDTELSGFFRLDAWLSLDRPDTDFQVALYEILPDGSSVYLADDLLRARYRKSTREAAPVTPGAIEKYHFDRFTFVSRLIKKGSRLRLVLGPINAYYSEKNYNSGGIVANESGKDGRPVTVTLYHDAQRPSALYLPIGKAD